MEGKVQDGVLDDLVLVVDLLEVVEGRLLDEVVALDPVDRVEVGNLQGEDVDRGGLQDELVLGPDSRLVGVEEGQELPVGGLAPLLLLVLLLLGVVLAVLVLLGLLALDLVLGGLGQHPEVPHFLFVPVDGDGNVLLAEVVVDEGVGVGVVDVEAVVDG